VLLVCSLRVSFLIFNLLTVITERNGSFPKIKFQFLHDGVIMYSSRAMKLKCSFIFDRTQYGDRVVYVNTVQRRATVQYNRQGNETLRIRRERGVKFPAFSD
jgi:hypothetical protein